MKISKKIYIFLMLVLTAFASVARAESGRITVAQAFYQLAHNNNVSRIRNLISRGYSIESIDERGHSALCLSVLKQDKRAYRTLVAQGANTRPACMRQIPQDAYQRFFGTPTPYAAQSATYVSDQSYLIGAAVLGAGAVAVAYILRGELDKGSGGSSDDEDNTKKCRNGTYNEATQSCKCNEGYGNFGDREKCYENIQYCQTQKKNKCEACAPSYVLKDNVCYEKIPNCEKQNGAVCDKCVSGYGTYGGDNKYCYKDIPYCKVQNKETCEECVSGYGIHGDTSQCIEDVAHCLNQVITFCKQCEPGYDTYGDPTGSMCYKTNPCAQYAHTVPVHSQGVVDCRCDANKGYFGEPENCTQAEDGEYQEGEGEHEEWNNLNEKYCHSHGKYDTTARLCICYKGYADSTNGCAECAEDYIESSGICYRDLRCKDRGEGYIQVGNSCICDEDYFDYNGTCTPKVDCKAYNVNTKQVAPGPDPEQACQCKPNFDENCERCAEGYIPVDYYGDGDIECWIEAENIECDEKWVGDECNICPVEYKVTYDEDGGAHCGLACADNREDIETNEDCSKCAEGYEYSEMIGNCIVTGCSSGIEGYVYDESGQCVCDTENGYVMSLLGQCEKKGEDQIGLRDRNINNDTISVVNDGTDSDIHDVYGMKPVLSEDEGEGEVYYENVYNALSQKGEQIGAINITNTNTGANSVYGIYSPSNIYNAASIMTDGGEDTQAIGSIRIVDKKTMSDVYGLYNNSSDSIYNALAHSSIQAEATSAFKSTASGKIEIKKENSSGKITGIKGSGNIYNSYADSQDGVAANTEATANIDLLHSGTGDVIGIHGTNTSKKINNSLAYLDSAISDVISTGKIDVTGNNNVYGIYGNGTIINSETQFKKKFNQINNFSSKGIINATTKTKDGTAYGIYLYNDGNPKVEVYNAMGYNSTGEINVTNEGGGNAYGIVNEVKTYEEDDGEGMKSYYNNTYNAFRSSAKYGDEDSQAKGNINVKIQGYSSSLHQAVGIKASGNVFNSYANSGSDVELITRGNIIIDDKSDTSAIKLRGIESGGATIANAYSTGKNENTATKVYGNIEINTIGRKQGSIGEAAGIYSNEPSSMTAQIYNAALVNDKNNVEGNITISGQGYSNFSRMYGIYASRYEIEGGNPAEGQEKTVYNAYYYNEDEEESGGSVHGKISVLAPNKSPSSSGEYYGIYVNEGTAYNAYASNANANVKGEIEVKVAGGENKGVAVGMYGNNSFLYNNGSQSRIDVLTTRENSKAYGMKGDDSYIENDAQINVVSEKSEAYGLYANRGQAINKENGVINVSGKEGSYGIYVLADGTSAGSAEALNLGRINLSGDKNVGIYASGANATVENRGQIFINDAINNDICQTEDCSDNVAIQLVDGAELKNSGTIESNNDLDLSAVDGNIILMKGGSFKAENSIKGNIKVTSDVIKDTFATSAVLSDSIQAADTTDLTLSSQSYLYNVNSEAKEDGKYDVVMQIKDFSEITNNESEANYLEKNYTNERNMALFNALKSASTAAEEEKIKADAMGTSMIPNITEEELKVQRSLDRVIANNLFTEGDQVRKMVGGDAAYIGRDDHNSLTGYDVSSQSMYALYDQKLNNQYRLGLGLSFTNTDTDYNNNSSRKNFTVQGYVPMTYTNNQGLTAVSMARLGYADGDYKRRANSKVYDADTNEIVYGLINELRYKKAMKYVNLTPFIGLNAIGWYQNGIKEGKDAMALNIASSHVFSLESALGLYVDREIEFNQDNKLNIALGLGYYHEFADPYRGFDAHHGDGALGTYRLKHKMGSDDRGMLSAKINYDYKNFSIYGELMQYIEKEHPLEVEGGVRYRF